MAVNSDSTNKLYLANDTSVKFFCSLTRRLATGVDSFVYNGETKTISDFPGAICYVSDNSGNSIFLNKLLFGDGAKAGSGGSGGGITEVTLDMIPVVTVNNTVLKSLADYFNADGKFITEGITITKTNADDTVTDVITIDKDGIKIGGSTVITETYLGTYMTGQRSEITTEIGNAELAAKDYADGLITSVYIVKGTVLQYSDLSKISNPKVGWVYNVVLANGNIPSGTNYVYTDTGWDALGGTIDFSNYKTKADTEQAIADALSAAKTYADGLKTDIDSDISDITSSITSTNNRIDGVVTDIGTINTSISTNTTKISLNETNITNISTQLTWQ